MAKAGEVATFLKDIAALSTESLRLNTEELAEAKETRRQAASIKEERERAAIEIRRERLLRGFTDPKKIGAFAVKAPFKAIEGARETTRWLKSSILGTTTKSFFGLMTKSISLGFSGFAGALKGIGKGMSGVLGGSLKLLAALSGPLLAGIGMLLGPMGIGLAAIGYLGYNMLKTYSGKPEAKLMAHFGINKEDIKLSHRMGFGFDQAIGGIAGLIDSFMRSMGFQSNLKDKYTGLGIGDSIQNFMKEFDVHMEFINKSIENMFKEGGPIDQFKGFFKEGSYFDKIVTSWVKHVNPAIKQFYTDIIAPFIPEIEGKEIKKTISKGTATFFMGGEDDPGSIRNMLKNLGAGIKGASEFVATLFWGEKEYIGAGMTKRSGKGLFGFMGRVGSGFSSAWENMEFKNFNRLMAVLFGETGKKGIIQQLGEAFKEGALKADYTNIFTLLFKALDDLAGVLLEIPYMFNVLKNNLLHMVGKIGDAEFESKMAKLELGRTKDPEEQKALKERIAKTSVTAVEELATEFATEQQLGSLKKSTDYMSTTQYMTAFGAGAGGVATAGFLAGGPIGWAIGIGVGLGAALGYLVSVFAKMYNNPNITGKDRRAILNGIIEHAKKLLKNAESDTNTRNGARRLIEQAKLAIEFLPVIEQIEIEEKKAKVTKKEKEKAFWQGEADKNRNLMFGGVEPEYMKDWKWATGGEDLSSTPINIKSNPSDATKYEYMKEQYVGSLEPGSQAGGPVTIINNNGTSVSNISGSSSPSASQYMTYPLQIA